MSRLSQRIFSIDYSMKGGHPNVHAREKMLILLNSSQSLDHLHTAKSMVYSNSPSPINLTNVEKRLNLTSTVYL